MSEGQVWTATMKLRIVRPVKADSITICGPDRLQQAWRCLETGEIEWRDVEIIKLP